MANLDNFSAIRALDKENHLANIQDSPEQVETTWADFKNQGLPTLFINAKSVLILGMGGSAQGGGIVASLAQNQSSIPIYVLRDYDIPGWVDKNTLVIAVSYSGETEEVISAFMAACKHTDKLITISTGGRIYSLGTQHKAFHYRVRYGAQPRAAMGVLLTAVLAIFSKLKIIEISDDDISEAVLLMRALKKKIDVEVPERRNPAKVLAKKIVGRIPIIYGSGNLSEVARRIKGQFNESSKTVSFFEVLPELNHNSLAGLVFPEDIRQKLFFLILESKYDHERNKLRQSIVAQIFEQKKLSYETINIEPAGNPFSEIMQVILFTDYTSYYLAMLNNVAPDPVEIVEFLKGKLAEKPFLE